MTTEKRARPVIRNAFDVPEERGVCGFRRQLITEADTPAANVSYLRIDNSRYHYHKKMTEFYYVISGGGTVTLDGETHPVKAGDIVVIPPGVWHTSDGEMDVLITGVPPQETTDVWFE